MFVKVRDVTRIAITVHLPANRLVDRRPAIVRQTRYMRGLAPASRVSKWINRPSTFELHRRLRTRFLRAGYAWVRMYDVGSGDSGRLWRTPSFEDQRHHAN